MPPQNVNSIQQQDSKSNENLVSENSSAKRLQRSTSAMGNSRQSMMVGRRMHAKSHPESAGMTGLPPHRTDASKYLWKSIQRKGGAGHLVSSQTHSRWSSSSPGGASRFNKLPKGMLEKNASSFDSPDSITDYDSSYWVDYPRDVNLSTGENQKGGEEDPHFPWWHAPNLTTVEERELSAEAIIPQNELMVSSKKRTRYGGLQEPFSRILYQLIVRQLYGDGLVCAAEAVASASGVLIPSLDDNPNRLKALVRNGLVIERTEALELTTFNAMEIVERHMSETNLYIPPRLSTNAGISSSGNGSWGTGGFTTYRERFVTATLNGPIRALRFSPSGKYVACAGLNGLATIFSLDTMEEETVLGSVRQRVVRRKIDEILIQNASAKGKGLSGNTGGEEWSGTSTHLVTSLSQARYFEYAISPPNYAGKRDRIGSAVGGSIGGTPHTSQGIVETVAFSPHNNPWIAFGGLNGVISIWDYQSPIPRRIAQLQDTFPIRSIAFHPSGQYLLYATDHPQPRLWNIETGTELSPHTIPHNAALTDVCFSNDGHVFVVGSLDGSYSVMDTTNGKVMFHQENAHSGTSITSVSLSRTGNMILTSGLDSMPRLWDLRRGSVKEVLSFGEPQKCLHRSMQARFNSHETHVWCNDSSLNSLHAYDVFDGQCSATLTVPTQRQRGFDTSPFGPIVITGGDDSRMRLWTPSYMFGPVESI